MSDKKLRNFIRDIINEQTSTETWYHGTPDSREVKEKGGFTDRTKSVDYVIDPEKLLVHYDKMKAARESGNMDAYHDLLNVVSSFKKQFTYKTPIFLSDSYSVAKTYANARRSGDYQNAVEKVLEVEVKCGSVVKIVAKGDAFRTISVDKVKRGFMNSGVSEPDITKLIAMFNYHSSDGKGIKTDTIAAIASFLKFDCVDVIGVLDSYDGGKVKSTVRMVLNPSNVKVK